MVQSRNIICGGGKPVRDHVLVAALLLGGAEQMGGGGLGSSQACKAGLNNR